MNDSLYTLTLTSPFAPSDHDNVESDDADQGHSTCKFDYSTNILQYATEPDEIPTEGTYGIELELNPPRRNGREKFIEGVNAVFAACPHFFVKSDGSIDAAGGEIVTTPRTLAGHNVLFEAVEAHRDNFRPESSCGFHVHAAVPNNLFSTARAYQLVMDPAFEKFISAIAQRPANSYCQRAMRTITADVATSWAAARYPNHYTAFTFSGKGTVEFRLFAARTKRYLLASYVEFADAVLAFSATRSLADDAGSGARVILAAFCDYVLNNRKRYPNLYYRLNLPTMKAVIARIFTTNDTFDTTLFRKQLTPISQRGSM